MRGVGWPTRVIPLIDTMPKSRFHLFLLSGLAELIRRAWRISTGESSAARRKSPTCRGLHQQLLVVGLALTAPVLGQDRARLEVDYRGELLVIEADRIISADPTIAEGDVVVTYEDLTLKTGRLIYHRNRNLVVAEDGIEVTQGIQWLKGTNGEFKLGDKTGFIDNAEGFTDDELFVRARRLLKTGPNTYKVQDGFLTACEEAVPKWSFSVSNATLKVASSASATHAILKIKKVPVFYLPYLRVPVRQDQRSTGFLLPSTGTSSNKGRRITQGFYVVLGRSADLLIEEDYFSERGFGHSFTFRTRPNRNSYLYLNGYAINDRKDQGGTSFTGTGQTRFGDGYRLVADFNLVSNFVFRRVFADSFYLATKPTEASHLFLTRNAGPSSLNVRLSREETVFRTRNAVTTAAPSFQFNLNGLQISDLPIYFALDALAEGVSRVDSQIETPALTQRLDFYPRFYFSLDLPQGLKLTPRIGVRETFYSNSLEQTTSGKEEVTSVNLNRDYFDFTLTLDGWGLSKIYRQGSSRAIKHLIEPLFRYRYTTGIDNYTETILFDERDAIANTNEVEFGLVNRFFVRGRSGTREWLSVKVAQKYFADPGFGGAFQSGVNQFFPLYTLTGFHYGAIERRFSPLTTVARITPSRRFSFDVHSDYDVSFNRLRNLAVTGFLNRGRLGLATTYFLTEELEAGTRKNNQLQGSVRWGNFRRGLSFTNIFSYDARSKALLNLRARANYFWDCCGIAVEYQRLNLGLRQEREIRFSFFLKGIGSFGTIRRPDTLF